VREAEGATAKAQKAQLAAALNARATSPGEAWTPGWMQVPPTRHVEGAACPPADAWDRIAGLFGSDAERETGAGPSSCNARAA
jgi:ParB family transcriptional regulator, chromosome partitioning protein